MVNALKKDSVETFAKKAAELGPVMYFIDTAGASPNQANPQHIVDLDMVGTGYAVDAFGQVMAEGGAGLIISSQAAYMYPIPNDVELQLVRTPTEELKNVKFVQEVAMQNSGLAYMIAKRMIDASAGAQPPATRLPRPQPSCWASMHGSSPAPTCSSTEASSLLSARANINWGNDSTKD